MAEYDWDFEEYSTERKFPRQRSVVRSVPSVPSMSGTKEERIKSLQEVVKLVGVMLDDIDSWPSEPENDGAVVTFSRKFTPRGQIYSYAAIRAVGKWYVTGSSTEPFTWDELMDWMGEDKNTLNLVIEQEKL